MSRKRNVMFYNQLGDNQGGISNNNLNTSNPPEISTPESGLKKTDIPFFSISGNNYSDISKKNLNTSNPGEEAKINKTIKFNYYVEFDRQSKFLKPGAEIFN